MKIGEIIKFLKEKRTFLKEKFAIKEIGVFGSYSKGEEKDISDIDVYVVFDMEALTFDKYLSLIEFLENSFGKKIDLITKDGLESIRIPEIKKEIKESIIYA
ncbi:MAG: nucleotidyltransferase family protein [Candidatus Ratteibacteria bacterium]